MSQHNAGFSLVEFLVAIAIGLTLIAGISTLYLSQLKMYRFSQAIERLQENGRIASQQFTKDINMAGYCGCARLNEVTIHNSLSSVDFNPSNSLLGFHDGYSISVSPTIAAVLETALPNTDQILIQKADGKSIPAKTENSVIKVQENPNFNIGNILLIYNCTAASLLQVAKLQQQTIIPTQELTENYTDQNAQISRFSSIIYYLADTERKNIAGNNIYALYRRDLTGAFSKQNEFIENVEDMKIYYGSSNNKGSGFQYYSAEQVRSWEKVKVVKIALLLVSHDAVYDQPQNFRFLNRVRLAPDRRLRREWDIVVALRERNHE